PSVRRGPAAGGAVTHPAPIGERTPGRGDAHPEASSQRVVAVVVTYNREELLQQCLDGLAAQERLPDAVVVIDNASTDASGGAEEGSPPGWPATWCATTPTGAG